jgi:hypothetical protein
MADSGGNGGAGCPQGPLPPRTVPTVMLLLIVVPGGLAAILWWVVTWKGDPQYKIPAMVAIGAVGCLVALTVFVVALRPLGLTNTKEAWGLPAGSIRAALAITLVIIFAITFVFLYVHLSAVTVEETKLLSLADAEKAKLVLPAIGAAAVYRKGPREDTDAVPLDQLRTAALAGEAPAMPGPPPTPPRTLKGIILYYQSGSTADSVDFAKQGFTALLTLIAAVVSFYFAARTAGAESTATLDRLLQQFGGGPAQAGGFEVTPVPTQPKVGDTVHVVIAGPGLAGAAEAELVREGAKGPIPAKSVVPSGDRSVTCEFDLKPAVAGSWDIILKKAGGALILPPPKLSLAIQLPAAAPPPPGPAAGTPAVTTDPPEPVRGKPLSVTIRAPGVAEAKKLELTHGTETVPAEDVALASGTSVTFKVKELPSNMAAGDWKIVLKKEDGTEIPLPSGLSVKIP